MTKHTHNIDLYDDIERIKAALMETGYDVKDKAAEILNDSVDNVKEQTFAVKENLENYTANQPIKSLGIAMLVGVAIGYLLHK